MIVLTDTSILVRVFDQSSHQSAAARTCIQGLAERGHTTVAAPQCIYEFWAVLTRPRTVNGMGCSPSDAAIVVQEVQTAYSILPDPEGLLARWLGLVTSRKVSGKQAHDARLVAFMLEHEIEHIVTFNGADFVRYPEVMVIDPRDPATYSSL